MINSIYLRKDVQSQMKSSFDQQGILVLNDFLDMEGLDKAKSLWNAKTKKEFRADLCSYDNILDDKSLVNGDFLSFLSEIIGKQPKKIKIEARKFGHRDFILIHDEARQQKRFIILYRNAKEWDSSWGGQAVFTRKNANPLILPVVSNQLVIVACDKDVFEFVKYINNLARDRKFLEVKITVQ